MAGASCCEFTTGTGPSLRTPIGPTWSMRVGWCGEIRDNVVRLSEYVSSPRSRGDERRWEWGRAPRVRTSGCTYVAVPVPRRHDTVSSSRQAVCVANLPRPRAGNGPRSPATCERRAFTRLPCDSMYSLCSRYVGELNLRQPHAGTLQTFTRDKLKTGVSPGTINRNLQVSVPEARSSGLRPATRPLLEGSANQKRAHWI